MHKLCAKLQLLLNRSIFKKSLKEKHEIISCCKVYKRNRASKNPNGEDRTDRESKNPNGENRNEESLGIMKKG